MNAENSSPIVVVGAGVIGLSTALHLRETYPDRSIVVLEAGATATGIAIVIGATPDLIVDVVGVDGRRMAGIVVVVEEEGSSEASAPRLTAVTDAAGRVEFAEVPAQRHGQVAGAAQDPGRHQREDRPVVQHPHQHRAHPDREGLRGGGQHLHRRADPAHQPGRGLLLQQGAERDEDQRETAAEDRDPGQQLPHLVHERDRGEAQRHDDQPEHDGARLAVPLHDAAGHQPDEDIDSVWTKRPYGWSDVSDFTTTDEIVVTKVLWSPPAVSE